MRDLGSEPEHVLKTIQYSSLVSILQEICSESLIERSEKSSSWDFERSVPVLKRHALQDNIRFPRRDFQSFPLNSERHLYELNNITISRLQIQLDQRKGLAVESDWQPLSNAKWHFESCSFEPASANMWPLAFPWRGSFRFYKNRFAFPSRRIENHWLFVFGFGSRLLFHGNDFLRSNIELVGSSEAKDGDTTRTDSKQGNASFVGNRGMESLGVREGFSSVAFTGMNHVDMLWLSQLDDSEHEQILSVHFGPRERIDPNFQYAMHHRRLFVGLKGIAVSNNDTRQGKILDRHVDRIDYFLNKGEDTPSPMDFRVWIEYWQDRGLYAWRRWSSDFYRSWLRPLLMLVAGYSVLNAVPLLFLEAFSFQHWVEFSLRPVNRVAAYGSTLAQMFPCHYELLSLESKNALRLVGLCEVIWIAMWGFAFARSVKR